MKETGVIVTGDLIEREESPPAPHFLDSDNACVPVYRLKIFHPDETSVNLSYLGYHIQLILGSPITSSAMDFLPRSVSTMCSSTVSRAIRSITPVPRVIVRDSARSSDWRRSRRLNELLK